MDHGCSDKRKIKYQDSTAVGVSIYLDRNECEGTANSEKITNMKTRPVTIGTFVLEIETHCVIDTT